MSSPRKSPAYPVKGLIISGDPIPTTATPGCGELYATGVQDSQVDAPGLTTLRVTGSKPAVRGPKSTDCKPKVAAKPKVRSSPGGGVPLSFEASTSSAAKQARVGTKATKPPGFKGNIPYVQVVQGGPSASKSGSSTVPPLSQHGPSTPRSGSSTVSPKSKDPKHVAPSRRAFVNRRSANRIVERLRAKPSNTLTGEEKSKLDWATALLAEQGASNSTSKTEVAKPAVEVPKRQRSEEESPLQKLQPRTKRPKSAPIVVNRPFSEVAKNPLVRAVIDRNNSDGAISFENWGLIRQNLMGAYWKILKDHPGPVPQNKDAGWFQGHIKLLACANERSLHLLQLAIKSLGELWPGAKLDLVPVCEIPRRPRSTAKIPAEPHKPAEILAFLQSGNPHLPTHDWKVVKVSAPMGMLRKVVVVLNRESLAPLRASGGVVYYGFDSITLSVYRSDDKTDPVTSGESLEVPSRSDVNADDPTCSTSQEDVQSNISVGNLFESLNMVEDEDSLLESGSDSEEVNVTVVYDPDHGEDNSD